MTDMNENDMKFAKVLTDVAVRKGDKISLENIEVICFEDLLVKIETTEGFHTKRVKCGSDGAIG